MSNVFWLPTIGKKLRIAQEDVIKQEKYVVFVVTHSSATTTAHLMAFATKLTSNNLHYDI